MRRILRFLALVGGLLLVLFFLGPQPDREIAVRFDPSVIGDDIDGYLSASEKQVPNLVPGAEKEVVWANPATREKTPVSVVYVHGFSATKHEIRPVPDNLARALGANLYFTRITGHGRDGEGLAEAKLQDWANDIAEAVAIGERLGEKVLLMATSNGGAITTWGLSNSELAKNVAGVVFFSPAYEIQGLPTWLANIPWAETIIPTLAGAERSWEPQNELHGKWWTNSYPSAAVFPMTSLLQVLKEVNFQDINVPALFLYAPDDQVVAGSEIAAVASQWGGPVQTVEVTQSNDPYNHVIAGDILSPDNTEPLSAKVIEWAKDTLSQN